MRKKAGGSRKVRTRTSRLNVEKLNVENLSLKALNDLESQLQTAKAAARDRVKSELRQKIDSLLAGTGLTVHDIYGTAGKRKGKSLGVAKYANPDNRAETWTGRGRKPNWLVARLKKGGKLSDYTI